ncbi:response regulator [Paenibacillus oryzisoli]|uniref:response regulator transcription factor n=1 Tax=Paenibacillus oryzisoli TaxID=1850517 RepID=UPI003D2862C3
MIKVMLVDDDAPMFRFLRSLIPWEEMGLQIVATAQSGIKALQLFKELMPQLVITDIGMPKMDGIELANQLRQIKSDVRIIFLTCHADFHFAKKAVQVSADDYLIKDELTSDMLKQSIEKSVKLMGLLHSENTVYREEFDRNSDILKKAFWKQILSGDHSEIVLNSGRRLGIDWKDPYFLLGMFHLDFASLIRRYGLQDKQLIYYAVYNITRELASDVNGLSVFANDELELYVVMNYQRNLAVNAQEDFRRFASDLKSKVEHYLKLSSYFVLSYEFNRLSVFPRVFEELKVYNRGLYYDSSSFQVMLPREVRTFTNTFNPKGEIFKETLLQKFRDHDFEGFVAEMKHLAKRLLADQPTPSSIMIHLSQWVRLIEYEAGYEIDRTLFYQGLESTIRLQELLQSINERIQRMISDGSDLGSSGMDQQKLQLIDRYIMEHLSVTISLVSIANHIYLNPSYFSRFFKKMTGVNFTDYVNQFKMNLALQMLRNKEMSVELIAAKLGYSDRTYFSKVFKKYNGISPVDYKNKDRNSK